MGEQGKQLKNYTTMGIGGMAKFFKIAKTQKNLITFITQAKEKNIPYLLLGGGSNMLISDQGFPGLVIKNEVRGINLPDQVLEAQSGTQLQDLVDFTVEHNLSGLQKLVGIPGTVGGAVFGNAGAYGASISDYLIGVTAFDPEQNEITLLTKKDCQFGYRHSVFKRNGMVILEAHFKFPRLQKETLEAQIREVLKDRSSKNFYQGKSPGSFFKNIPVETISPKSLKLIPQDKIIQGKIPAGYLLEEIGAKGMTIGQIQVSPNHANFIINLGEGKAEDVLKLASILQQKVKDKFGITLEPEVQFINLPPFNLAKESKTKKDINQKKA